MPTVFCGRSKLTLDDEEMAALGLEPGQRVPNGQRLDVVAAALRTIERQGAKLFAREQADIASMPSRIAAPPDAARLTS